ncbi:hypothetical protein [Parasphingorhabdus sp.]|uniref:hypothetical protein n=1 Tax=Parasphingorhabdus sp. TaxID=2709688 RepID=UPI003001DE9D
MRDSPKIQTEKFMSAVGRGLRTWTKIENAMFLLFTQVSGTDQHRATLIFAAIISLEVRLSILNTLRQTDKAEV